MRVPAYALYTQQSYRNANFLSEELKAKVCVCWEPGSIVPFKFLGVCSKCKLPESYYVYQCIGCGESFLHDFVDQFCYKEPACWDCLSIDKPAPCSGHNYCVNYSVKTHPPIIVPKKRQTVNFAEEVPALIL